MPIVDTLSARDMRGRVLNEDTLGLDRVVRSFLRTCVRLGPGALAMVQGGPGAGKTEFLRRCAHAIELDRDGLGPDAATGLYQGTVWYNPWMYAKQGNVLAGLVSAMCKSAGNGAAILDRGRDVSTNLMRMRFDGTVPDAVGAGLNPSDVDPLDRVRRGFALLADQVKAGQPGRLVIFIADLEQLPANVRMNFLDGLKLLLGGGADVLVIVAMGREAAVSAIRAREGDVPDASAHKILDELVDLAISVPKVDVRRIGLLLRRFLTPQGEGLVRRAFGSETIEQLLASAGYRALGTPRFVERLAMRVLLLSEFAMEARASRVIGESEWSWIVLSERWPDFRRFLIRGGSDRWADLKETVAALSDADAAIRRPDLWKWLEDDLILNEYLRIYADAFERDVEAVHWIEDLQQAAGL